MNPLSIPLGSRLSPVRSFTLCASVIFLLGGLADAFAAGPGGLDNRTLVQIEALQQEKLGRTAAQQKLDSQLIYAGKTARGQAIANGVPALQADLSVRSDGRVLVDIDAVVSDALLTRIKTNGGQVINSFPRYRAIRAWLPLAFVETLAEEADVRFIRPAATATTNSGSVNSQGDVTHQADVARSTFGINGTGVKMGVLSDSVDFLANSQSLGDLGTVTVLSGQTGSGAGEGTAMLEIVHDLAPGAQLYFATAFNGIASFAQNIHDLRTAGCDVIIDDVTYFNESPFQDATIAQAVNDVSASGALYFSSARNSGNKNDGTSGTWEGNFLDGGAAAIGRGGRLHDFGGATFDTVSAGGSSRRVDLFWADPLGGSGNDYDLYVTDSSGNVLRSSTTTQNGFSDPYEAVSTLNVGERIVIVKFSGADRFLHLDTGRAILAISTDGNVRGHNASGATNAFSVAATWVRNPAVAFTGGGINPVETYSSDGPRRIFFNPDGSPITPGDFSATGGLVLPKPDITAADGVVTTLSSGSGLNPFFGTSAAAPHAGAIAALIKSFNPALTPLQIRDVMQSTALDIEAPGVDRDSGVGIVMALPALQAVVANQSSLSISDASVVEGNSGSTNIIFIVTLLPASTNTVAVNFATANGSAQAGSDYVATNDSLTFLPGETNHNIIVQVLGDTLAESDETFSVNLSSPTNAFLSASSGTGTILNDDAPPNLTVVDATVTEGNLGTTGAVFVVTLSGPSGSTITANFATLDGTALAGSDYLAANAIISLPPGITSTNVVVQVLGDTTLEPDENFTLTLSAPVNATLAVSNAVGTILNDDGLPGQLDHFSWSSIASPQSVSQPFGVVLTALDYFNDPVTNFSGAASLSASGVGSGTVFQADFESGLQGFTVDNTLGSGGGLWHLSTGRGNNTGHTPTSSFYFGTGEGAGGGGSYNTGSVSEGAVISPAINLAGAAAPITLQFNYLLQTEGIVSYDIALVEISTNNGASFTTLANANLAGPLTNNTAGAWLHATVDLATYVGQQIKLRFHFNTVDNVANTFEGWYVDDVTIVSAQGNPAISPTLTGAFSDGVWTGTVTVLQPTANVFLRASDSDGHTNDSNLFDVLVGDDVSLAMIGSPAPVAAGGLLTYNLTVANSGPGNATGLLLTNLLPTSVTNPLVTLSQGTFTVSSNVVVCDLGTLNAASNATVTIAVTPLAAGLITNQASIARPGPDGDPANNSASLITLVTAPTIVPVGFTVVADLCNTNGKVDAGELVVLGFALQNSGVTGTVSNLTATLLPAPDVFTPSGTQSYGLLTPGAMATNLFAFRANAVCGATIHPMLQLQDGAINLGTASFAITLGSVAGTLITTFTNSGFITIPDSGAAAPYPSAITVSNVAGSLLKVTAKLKNLDHTWPDDLDILLVGPGGQKVMLMSDAGGSFHLNSVTLTFDSAAGSALPDSAQIVTGTYRPTDFEIGGSLTSPAPAAPYATNLFAFTNSSPNGTWQLYVFDDASGDQGDIAGGWELALTTASVASCCQSPLEFVGPVIYTNGMIRLNAFFTPGQNYQIQASTNLFDWVPVTNVSSTSAPVLIVDPAASNYPARFYRGLSQ